MMPVLVLLLTACNGCAGCFGGLPSSNNNDNNNDPPIDDPSDDGDAGGGVGGGTGDLVDPPPCDVPEEEPNDSRSEAQVLPMEQWACGFISEQGDVESFTTTMPEEGWMTLWARGADFGSTADLLLLLENMDDNDYAARQGWMVGSTDAILTVPVADASDWLVQVVDEQSTFSDTHEWQLIATADKPPVEWGFVEDEASGNNAITTGDLLQDGDFVYGVLERNDQDFYRIEIPPGRTQLYARVHAWRYGSPADTVLSLYRPNENLVRTRNSGENDYDQDPMMDRTIYDDGTWYLKVDLAGAGGSPLYWYVLEIGLDNDPPDTGGDDSGQADAGAE